MVLCNYNDIYTNINCIQLEIYFMVNTLYCQIEYDLINKPQKISKRTYP